MTTIDTSALNQVAPKQGPGKDKAQTDGDGKGHGKFADAFANLANTVAGSGAANLEAVANRASGAEAAAADGGRSPKSIGQKLPSSHRSGGFPALTDAARLLDDAGSADATGAVAIVPAASGVRTVGGQATTATASDTVVTGLSKLIGVVATLDEVGAVVDDWVAAGARVLRFLHLKRAHARRSRELRPRGSAGVAARWRHEPRPGNGVGLGAGVRELWRWRGGLVVLSNRALQQPNATASVPRWARAARPRACRPRLLAAVLRWRATVGVRC